MVDYNHSSSSVVQQASFFVLSFVSNNLVIDFVDLGGSYLLGLTQHLDLLVYTSYPVRKFLPLILSIFHLCHPSP